MLAAGVFAAYRFTLINQHSAANSISSASSIIFYNNETSNWGSPKVAPLARLTDPAAGFLVGDRLRLKVEVVC